MSAVAKTRLFTETAKAAVNHNASTITKDRLVGFGTPTGTERACDGLNVAGVTKIMGAIQEDVAAEGHVTVFGPGSIVQLESDGSGTIASGVDVVAVAGASLAVSGRVKTLPGTTGTHVKVGKHVGPTTIAANAGDKLLVELCEPTPVYVP